MATRRQIREQFYAELEAAADPHIDPSNIGQEEPDSDEDLPAIVHDDDYRKLQINRSNAPTRITTDANGHVDTQSYSICMEGRFTVLIADDDEQTKEDAYEAVRSHFEDFTCPIRDASEIQSDAYRVEVTDANSRDFTDRDPSARGDSLAISVHYERLPTEDVSAVEEVDQNVDADDDGTVDITYTTN